MPEQVNALAVQILVASDVILDAEFIQPVDDAEIGRKLPRRLSGEPAVVPRSHVDDRPSARAEDHPRPVGVELVARPAEVVVLLQLEIVSMENGHVPCEQLGAGSIERKAVVGVGEVGAGRHQQRTGDRGSAAPGRTKNGMCSSTPSPRSRMA